MADIPWDGNVLWKHHQAYIRRDISSPKKLKGNTVRNRELADFFGNEATDHFWEELSVLEIYPDVNGATIDLAKFKDDLPSFARSLVNAIQSLLDSDKVSDNAQRSDKFKEELRQRFLQSPYRDVHEALFDLSGRLAHVWLAGKGDYGVRTAHKDHTRRSQSLDKPQPMQPSGLEGGGKGKRGDHILKAMATLAKAGIQNASA